MDHSERRGEWPNRNLTIQLDDDVIHRAKVLAASRRMSVSAMVAHELERLVADAERYEVARQAALQSMQESVDRGGPMPKRAARSIVELYASWPVVATDVALISAAADLDERHGISFWDALIVEAARRAGADQLLTEDIESGMLIAGVRIENPFA